MGSESRRSPHLARLHVDGFTIVADYLTEDQLSRFREGLKRYLNTYRGRNPFEGLATERVYTLVGRGKIYEEIACDPSAARNPRPSARAQLPAERRPCHLHSFSWIATFSGNAAQSPLR